MRATPQRRGLFQHLTLEQYPTFVDGMGRVASSGKRGQIPHELPPIIEWLELNARRVVEEVTSVARWFGSVLGKPESCAAEAWRCNRSRLVSALRLNGG